MDRAMPPDLIVAPARGVLVRGAAWTRVPAVGLHGGHVTGDQFGWEPVLVADTEDPRFRANYREAAIEEHLEHVAGRIEGWLEEWAAERRAAFAPP